VDGFSIMALQIASYHEAGHFVVAEHFKFLPVAFVFPSQMESGLAAC